MKIKVILLFVIGVFMVSCGSGYENSSKKDASSKTIELRSMNIDTPPVPNYKTTKKDNPASSKHKER